VLVDFTNYGARHGRRVAPAAAAAAPSMVAAARAAASPSAAAVSRAAHAAGSVSALFRPIGGEDDIAGGSGQHSP
jgi:hypothetical protein